MLEQEWKKLSREFLGITPEQTDEQAPYNLIIPPSTCPQCHTAIKPWHNIPVFSYLCLKGRCKACQKPISIRYPLIEFITALLTLFIFWQYGLSYQFLAASLFSWLLLVLTMIDIDTQLLPDNLTIPLIWLGLIVNSFELFIPLQNSVLSAAGAYSFLWLFVWLFKLITGKEGMGQGDFKLFSAFGAWFGWQSLPFILTLASLVGAIIGIIILKSQKQSNDTPLAFGPYLCMAAYIYLLFGQAIIDWYLSLIL